MPSFTTSTLLLGLSAFATPSIAGYVLEDDYSPSNFFSMFSFFTGGGMNLFMICRSKANADLFQIQPMALSNMLTKPLRNRMV